MAQLDIDFGDDVKQADQPNNVSPTQALVSSWIAYAEVNKLNPKTKKYMEAQHAFLCGVGCGMKESTPMLISLCMASGRDIASLQQRTQPR